MQAKSRMGAREFERVQAGRDELAERITRLVAEVGSVEAAPGLDLFRYSSRTGPVYAVNEPSLCIIVQGNKELLLGNERYRYDASRYLLVSAGLPVVGRILEATKERPYLAVRIGLDPLVRKSYDKPLRIPSLARQLGMSTSGLHHHFKAVTAMSPLQFQKQLRLHEARRLLVAGDFDAATAGYRVGYDDAPQFSREYKRFFGEPPIRDVERLRGTQIG